MDNHISSKPASIPIYTKGNAFLRREERFLIRGISYAPNEGSYLSRRAPDLLADDRLEELKRDIEVFCELGLNTILVSALDPGKRHGKALKLLEEAGIYVLVKIFEDIKAPTMLPAKEWDPDFNTSSHDPLDTLKRTIDLIDELIEFPNILGFLVSGDAISSASVSKIAEVLRAAVADTKAYLRWRAGREIPVGINALDHTSMKLNVLQYFTAGLASNRVDFFASECRSWALKTNFQVSAYEDLKKSYAKYPVPMFITSYGAYMHGSPRTWEEIESFYSPDMTSVLSGCCVSTYFDEDNMYGLVKVLNDGSRAKKLDFELLKRRLEIVNKRAPHHLYSSYVRDYENWSCDFPSKIKHRWFATADIPRFRGKWEGLLQELKDDKEWEWVEAP